MQKSFSLKAIDDAKAELLAGGTGTLENPSDLYPKLGPFYLKITNYGQAKQIPIIGEFQPNPSEAYPGGNNYGQYLKTL